jgi:GMP synthase-like glutamine amidotransferase
MRVLIIQNFDGTEPGQIGTALAEAGAEIDLRKPYLGDPLPENAAGHDALVVLGGAQSALDDDDHPYIPPLLSLMRDFGDSGRSVLGICLGSQLLARAYGATNLLGAAPEFGWRGIAKTQEAATDPVLAAVSDSFTSFQWHDDTFTLPSGAVRLAANPAAENQAFRIGRASYGIQFHFEADRPMVSHWTKIFAGYLAERHPGWAHEEEAATHGPAADTAGLALARAWISTIAAGAVRPKSAA